MLATMVVLLAASVAGQDCEDCGATVYADELWLRMETYNTSDCSDGLQLESWVRNNSCVGLGFPVDRYVNFVASPHGIEVLDCSFNQQLVSSGYPLSGCFDCVSATPPTIYAFDTCRDGVTLSAPARPVNVSGWTTSRSRLKNRVDLDTGCVTSSPGNSLPGQVTRLRVCRNGTLWVRDCFDYACTDCREERSNAQCCSFGGTEGWRTSCRQFDFINFPRPNPSPPSPPPSESASLHPSPLPWFTLVAAVVAILL